MGRWSGLAQDPISLGIRLDRQLWLPDRIRRLLAPADAWRWAGQEIFNRGCPPGQGGPLKGSRADTRTSASPGTHRTRRLRSKCRLYMRRNASRRSDHLALCGIGHVLQFRDDQDFDADGSRCELMLHAPDRRGCSALQTSFTLFAHA